MRAFFAYPGISVISDIARAAANRASHGDFNIQLWEENDIAGRPLIEPILEAIEEADFLIGDITYLNFNVAFEIGYAISQGKRCLLVRNEAIPGDLERSRLVGIFDTLGYESYSNTDSLTDIIQKFSPDRPLSFEQTLDSQAPVYLLETPHRNEAMTIIASRLKKSRLRYRSYNPDEQTRLPVMEAIHQVARSFGVLIPLLSKRWKDYDIHNIRAAFVAGFSFGIEKVTLILQEVEGPFPVDVVDICKSYRHPDDIGGAIRDFALDVTEALQGQHDAPAPSLSRLGAITLGNPVAENEFETLSRYFLATDQYQRALRGEANLIVGRKGTGKTALFIQIRNYKRRNGRNVVVDLKPEGYQLVKLRDEVLSRLSQGAK